MSKITRMGIDLGKSHFRVCAMDRRGRVLMAKQFTRRGLEKFVLTQERCLVGMEACGGAHHWARMLRALGRARSACARPAQDTIARFALLSG